jgi:hypothetical protein
VALNLEARSGPNSAIPSLLYRRFALPHETPSAPERSASIHHADSCLVFLSAEGLCHAMSCPGRIAGFGSVRRLSPAFAEPDIPRCALAASSLSSGRCLLERVRRETRRERRNLYEGPPLLREDGRVSNFSRPCSV